MNAFLPYYRASKQQPKSGYKDDDYLEDACDSYEAKENIEFKFRHVVTYLQCMPKFDASLSEKEAEELAKPSGSNTNNNVPIMGGTMERPIGSKASKDLADSVLKTSRTSNLVERAKALEKRGKYEEADKVWKQIEDLDEQYALEDAALKAKANQEDQLPSAERMLEQTTAQNPTAAGDGGGVATGAAAIPPLREAV